MPSLNQIRQASWSVQYYTQFRSRADPGASVLPKIHGESLLLPIGLIEAIGILTSDYDEHDRARRRNAFVKLGTAGLFDQDRLRRFFGDDAKAQTAHTAIADLGKALGLQKVAEAMSWERKSLPGYVDKELWFVVRDNSECLPMDTTCVACLDGKTWDTTVTATARVPRPIEELAVVLDPRSWHRCGSSVFKDIQIMEFDPTVPEQWKIIKHPNLPRLGEPWSTIRKSPGDPELGLFEQVIIGATATDGFVAEFRNILNITLTKSLRNPNPQDDEIRLTFSLNTPLSSTLFGQEMAGGLVNDEGFGRAVRDQLSPADWTRVTMKKIVQFRDLTDNGGAFDYGELLNYIAPGLSCLWLEDSTELNPCCHPS
jgi:hypothetical protein